MRHSLSGGRSSVGRAPGLQPGGRRFDSGRLHQICHQICGKLFFVFMVFPVDLITNMSDNVYSEKTEKD